MEIHLAFLSIDELATKILAFWQSVFWGATRGQWLLAGTFVGLTVIAVLVFSYADFFRTVVLLGAFVELFFWFQGTNRAPATDLTIVVFVVICEIMGIASLRGLIEKYAAIISTPLPNEKPEEKNE